MTPDPTADPSPALPRRRSYVERLRAPAAGCGFVARLNASSSDIYLVRGNDSTGRPAWYYFRVGRGKKRAFETASKRGTLQLTEYGTILVSGYAKNPPPDVVKRMFDEYGFSEDTPAAPAEGAS